MPMYGQYNMGVTTQTQYKNMYRYLYVYGGMSYWRKNVLSSNTRPPQLIYSLWENKKKKKTSIKSKHALLSVLTDEP